MPYIPGDIAMWFDSFLKMIDLLLNIINFVGNGNWHGYLEAIYMFLAYRQNCAKNLSYYYYYYIDMLDLKSSNPRAYTYLEEGGFSGAQSGSTFSNIPMDQVIESTITRFSNRLVGLLERQRTWVLLISASDCITTFVR